MQVVNGVKSDGTAFEINENVNWHEHANYMQRLVKGICKIIFYERMNYVRYGLDCEFYDGYIGYPYTYEECKAVCRVFFYNMSLFDELYRQYFKLNETHIGNEDMVQKYNKNEIMQCLTEQKNDPLKIEGELVMVKKCMSAEQNKELIYTLVHNMFNLDFWRELIPAYKELRINSGADDWHKDKQEFYIRDIENVIDMAVNVFNMNVSFAACNIIIQYIKDQRRFREMILHRRKRRIIMEVTIAEKKGRTEENGEIYYEEYDNGADDEYWIGRDRRKIMAQRKIEEEEAYYFWGTMSEFVEKEVMFIVGTVLQITKIPLIHLIQSLRIEKNLIENECNVQIDDDNRLISTIANIEYRLGCHPKWAKNPIKLSRLCANKFIESIADKNNQFVPEIYNLLPLPSPTIEYIKNDYGDVKVQ